MRKYKFRAANGDEKRSFDCFQFKIPIYDQYLLIMDPNNSSKLDKFWGHSDDYGMKTQNFSYQSEILITINDWEDEYLVHELHHVVDLVMENLGHKRYGSSPVDEPSAYLIGYLYKEVMKNKDKLICKTK